MSTTEYCTSMGHENVRATRYMSCEDEGMHPYCDKCAETLRKAGEWDYGPAGSMFNLTSEQHGALKRIVTEWVDDGFLIPPYPSAYYDIFEALDVQSKIYDIDRPAR